MKDPAMKELSASGAIAPKTLALIGLFAALPPVLPAAPPPGQLLASMCAQCHGTNGQAVSGFESVLGRSAADMYGTLREMKYRPVEGIMDRQARGYTDAQLRLISEYLASLRRTNR